MKTNQEIIENVKEEVLEEVYHCLKTALILLGTTGVYEIAMAVI